MRGALVIDLALRVVNYMPLVANGVSYGSASTPVLEA